MKNCIILFCLVSIFGIVNAGPLNRPLKSRFDHLDKTQPDHERMTAAICVDTMHAIRKYTFQSAALQQHIETSQALNKPVESGLPEKLKTLNERLQFENDEYSENCI